MAEIFYVIKIIAILQAIIIIILLLLAYGVKIFSASKPARTQRITKEIEQLLLEFINNKKELNPTLLWCYKGSPELILATIDKFDLSLKTEKWKDIRTALMNEMVLPYAESLARSGAWYKRYLACQAFQLSLDKLNANTVKKLINDPVPLVAINAATLGLKFNSQNIVDTIIDVFAESRPLQQSLYTQVLSISKENKKLIPLVKNRLIRETNPYIKAFCYRTLVQLPIDSELVETIEEDFEMDNLNLKLSIMAYIAHINDQRASKFLVHHLTNDHWQIRARAAKLLGEIAAQSLAETLEKCLKDPTWWVRINAAEALAKLGEKGVLILKRQDPKVDKFAYDVAVQVLSENMDQMKAR